VTRFRSILSNTGVQIAGKGVTFVVSIVLLKLLAAGLGVDGYGQYVAILEVLAVFASIAEFGIYTIAVQELAAGGPGQMEATMGSFLGLRLIMAAVCALAAGATATLVPQYRGTPIVTGVWIGTSMIALRMMTGPMQAVLQVRYQMLRATVAEVCGRLAKLAWIVAGLVIAGSLAVGSAGLHFSSSSLSPRWLYWLIAGSSIGAAAQLAVVYIGVRREVRPHIRFDAAAWLPLLRRCLPYGLSVILSSLYFRIDVFLLSILAEPAELGVYAVAMRIIDNAGMVPVVFVNTLLPALSMELSRGDRRAARTLLTKSWLLLLAAAVSVVVLCVVLAKPLTLLLASSDYLSGGAQEYGTDVAIQLSIGAIVFTFLNRLFVFSSVALHNEKRVLYVNAIGVSVNLVANLIFIPIYGMRAAALTTVASAALALILNFRFVFTKLRFHPPIVGSLQVILAGVLTAATVLWIGQWLPATKPILCLLGAGGGGAVVATLSMLWVVRHASTKAIDP
jgi:O-antigen/teichoic acid export membrane protein